MIKNKDNLSFKETGYEEDLYEIIDSNGQILDTWADWAHRDFPEDLTIHRMIGDLILKFYKLGYKKALEDSND